MKLYWDMTEEERGLLTHEEVEAHIPYELMEQGCLPADPLTLEDYVEPEIEKQMFYRITWDDVTRYGRTSLNPLFTTVEKAKAALEEIEFVEVYDSQEMVAKLTDGRIESVELPLQASVAANKAALEVATAIKERNRTAQRSHSEAIEKQQKAVGRLWDNWHTCRETLARLEKVRNTFAEYKELAGDVGTARAFLKKVFPDELIHDALGDHAEAAPDPS